MKRAARVTRGIAGCLLFAVVVMALFGHAKGANDYWRNSLSISISTPCVYGCSYSIDYADGILLFSATKPGCVGNESLNQNAIRTLSNDETEQLFALLESANGRDSTI